MPATKLVQAYYSLLGVLLRWLLAIHAQVLSTQPDGVYCVQVHGAVCFFIPYYSLATSGKHNVTDVYSLGKVGRPL